MRIFIIMLILGALSWTGLARMLRGQVLSEREKEILILFLRGLTDRMVAERLQISERTVQGHRARIYGKFRVHTARELELLYDDINACLRTFA